MNHSRRISSNLISGNTNRNQETPSKQWCFTLNNYEMEDSSKIIDSFKDYGSKEYVFQEERGEEGTPHYQGYVSFTTKQRLTGLKKINPKIHWEKCRDRKASIKYCSDPAKRDGNIYAHNIKFKEKIRTIVKLYEWQEELLGLVKRDHYDYDTRSIYWYFDTDGNKGKTAICKYLAVHYDALVLSGKANDMFFAIASMDYAPKLILIDIPRSNIDYISYGGIEKIKDGIFFSSKYESKQYIMNSPTVICFANSMPDIGKMSLDRWRICNLDSGTYPDPIIPLPLIKSERY